MTSVAFIGLGAIGRPMALRIAAAGYDLVVWNRTADKAREFAAETGCDIADTPREAAAKAEVVITCLPSSREVEALLDGRNGLLAGFREGAALVDCTSGDPATSRRMEARLADAGIAFMDAPVSGGVIGAEKGTLTVMCGGDPALLERVRPLLSTFGQKLVHCGPVGSGDAVKAVNNAFLAIHIWSSAEGLVALTKAGVNPELALDVINGSSGRSNTTMNLFPERVLTRAFPRTFRLALLDKDVGIAAEVAREQKVAAPMMQLAAELMRVAHQELGDQADHVEAVQLVERWAGAEIR